MEQAQENREKFNLSSCRNGVRRDPLNKSVDRAFFLNGSEQQEEENGEIELSLGLSMNGRFGVDPTRKRLRRSSSISNLVFTVGSVADNGSAHQSRGVAFEGYAPLTRTCSLPTETVEELRRRKESQSMRRMEARIKRMEKLKNVGVVKDKESILESGNSDGLNGVINGSVYQRVDNENPDGFENGNGMLMPSPQGSIGSLGSGSSGISETQNQHIDAGMKQNSDVKIPSRIQSLPVQIEQKPGVKTAYNVANGAQEQMKNAMFDMPYVSTKGDGIKIDGFLYRYKKGEEVRIVCVCHGLFLSPAEFVKHGGGGDVENPLKHIVVNPSPLL